MRDTRFVAQVDRAHIGLRVEAKGHDAAVGDAADQRLHLGVVGAAHGQPVEGDVRDEIEKAFAQVLDRAPMFHMLGVDIGDDGDGRRQAVESAIGLVSLDHHPVTLAHPRVRAIGMDHAAIDHGRIDAARIQKRGHHGGGRGLAMRPRNRNVRTQAHQLGQHFSPAHNGQTPQPRGIKLGIAGLDRR